MVSADSFLVQHGATSKASQSAKDTSLSFQESFSISEQSSSRLYIHDEMILFLNWDFLDWFSLHEKASLVFLDSLLSLLDCDLTDLNLFKKFSFLFFFSSWLSSVTKQSLSSSFTEPLLTLIKLNFMLLLVWQCVGGEQAVLSLISSSS